jgi:hypothetical protein
MSKMCVSNYTLCFIGKIYFCFTALQIYELFPRVTVLWAKIFTVGGKIMAFARKLAEWQADIWLFFVIQQSQTAIAIVCH